MIVEVRLFATLREGREKVVFMDMAEGATVLVPVSQLNIPLEDIAILLVNGRDATLNTVLNENDKVSIFPPVGGG